MGVCGRSLTALVAVAMVVAACSSPSGDPPAEPTPTPSAPATGSAPEDDTDEAPSSDPRPDAAPDAGPEPESEPTVVEAGGVTAGDLVAAEVGVEVLEAGGNAVDAAVATAFAVSVVEPFASGLGGGGAALVVPVGEGGTAYNYREVVAVDGRVPASGVGIPGFVAGMVALLEAHGSLQLAQVVAPAIELARAGTPASATVAAQLRSAAYRLPVAELAHLFPEGRALDAGDPLIQEDLAQSLTRLAEDGAEAFYRGSIAESLVDVEGIDARSLDAYGVQVTEPVTGAFAGYEVVSAPPPLSGTVLIQLLQLAEARGVADQPAGSPDHLHTISTAWQVADRFGSEELGDPDVVGMPPPARTDAGANAQLAQQLSSERLVDPSTLEVPADDPGNTTHLTVVDDQGTMVSMTNTLSNFWGSGQVRGGFFLNSHLTRLAGGGEGSDAAEPGRRSASSSAPTVLRDGQGRPVLGLGSPGGSRIPNVLAQVLIGWAQQGASLQEAVDRPRFHLVGRDLRVEQALEPAVVEDLRGRGYGSVTVPDAPYYFGSVQALEVDFASDEIRGARDPRREADWVGTER